MKRTGLSLVLLMLIALGAKAQNVQLHYDFGEDRKLFTTTVEMFRPDAYGSTFFFIDLDYGGTSRNADMGVSLAYWEIARSIKWKEDQKLEPRVEFNSGMGAGTGYYYPINNSWLAGLQYTLNSADFSKVLTLQANYKYIQGVENASFQLTAVWGLHFLDNKLSFTGFADFWKQEDAFLGTDFVFLTEPQLWYNFNEHMSLGGELELSSNFGGNQGFMVNPTLAARYAF